MPIFVALLKCIYISMINKSSKNDRTVLSDLNLSVKVHITSPIPWVLVCIAPLRKEFPHPQQISRV